MNNAQNPQPLIRMMSILFTSFILVGIGLLAISLLQSRPVPVASAVPITSAISTASPTPYIFVLPTLIPTPEGDRVLLAPTFDSQLDVPENVKHFVFSPDGQFLAAIVEKPDEEFAHEIGQRTVYLWAMGKDMATSRRDVGPSDKNFRADVLTFSPDSKVLYAGGMYMTDAARGGILRWDTASGDEMLPLWELKEEGFAYHGHGSMLDIDPQSNTLSYLYSLSDGGCPHGYLVFYRRDLTTGRKVGFSSEDKTLSRIGSENNMTDNITNVRADAPYLAVHITDWPCPPYDEEKEFIAIFKDDVEVAVLPSAGLSGLGSMTFSADGHYFAGVSEAMDRQVSRFIHYITIWKDFEQVMRFSYIEDIQGIIISPDNRYVYALKLPGDVVASDFHAQFDVIDLAAGQWIATVDTDLNFHTQYPALPFALSPDGKHLVYAFEQHIFFVLLPDWETVVP